MVATFVKIVGQLSAGVKRQFLSLGKVRLALSWGFPYESYDPRAVVRTWHVMSLVESGRALSFNRFPDCPDEPFLNVQDLYSHYGLFQGSARLTLSKELYDVSLPKTPLTLEKSLVYVGRSSMNINTDVLLPSLGLTLASCEVQSVLVDRHSRRPAPHPDWWREKFGQFTSPDRQLKVIVVDEPRASDGCLDAAPRHQPMTDGGTSQVTSDPPITGAVTSDPPIRDAVSSDPSIRGAVTDPPIRDAVTDPPIRDAVTGQPVRNTVTDQPIRNAVTSNPTIKDTLTSPNTALAEQQDLPIGDSVTSVDVTVCDSDTDAYGHANWTVYVKYCLDALAMSSGADVARHMQSRAVRSVDIAYVSEGSVGQRLKVNFWKDTAAPGAVHFRIVDGDSGQLIVYAYVRFYSLGEVNLQSSKL